MLMVFAFSVYASYHIDFKPDLGVREKIVVESTAIEKILRGLNEPVLGFVNLGYAMGWEKYFDAGEAQFRFRATFAWEYMRWGFRYKYKKSPLK